MEKLLASSKEIVDKAIIDYKPYAIVLMLSGGDDSMTALAVTNKNKIRITWMDKELKRLDPEEIDESAGEYYTHWKILPKSPTI